MGYNSEMGAYIINCEPNYSAVIIQDYVKDPIRLTTETPRFDGYPDRSNAQGRRDLLEDSSEDSGITISSKV
jgi:hypothetical protein